MAELVNLVLAGLAAGALYAILASGSTLIYQTSGVVNFGQWAVAFATAYLFFQLNSGQGLPVVPSAVISIAVFAPLLGLVLHRRRVHLDRARRRGRLGATRDRVPRRRGRGEAVTATAAASSGSS